MADLLQVAHGSTNLNDKQQRRKDHHDTNENKLAGVCEMMDWKGKTDVLTQKGHIKVPYTWSAGATGSHFLLGLRDEKRIIGNRCPQCKTTYVPPRKNCGACFVDIDGFLDLPDEGVVTAHTIVRFRHDIHPIEPPFAYALIKLDGADVSLLHLIEDNLDALKNGVRVKAVFRDKRTGSILDIQSFTII
ncbi:MAG: Zn-ribbon domain-containing OB-fold protein [Pseudomonadota bacterium]